MIVTHVGAASCSSPKYEAGVDTSSLQAHPQELRP